MADESKRILWTVFYQIKVYLQKIHTFVLITQLNAR